LIWTCCIFSQQGGVIDFQKKKRLKEIEVQLDRAKHLLKAFLPLHMVIDRRVHGLNNEIKTLEDERLKVVEGQQSLFDEAF